MSEGRITVAVAQLAGHPALDGWACDPLADPLFDPARPNSSLRPSGELLPPPLERRMRTLEARVRAMFVAQLRSKLRAIVASCRNWGVELLVLPEAVLPRELLPEVGRYDFVTVVGDAPTADSDVSFYGTFGPFERHEPPQGRAVLLLQSDQLRWMRPIDDSEGAWHPCRVRHGNILVGARTLDEAQRRGAEPPDLPQKDCIGHVLALLGGFDLRGDSAIADDPRWRCPVLLANPATVGGSRIAAGDDAQAVDPWTFLPALAPGEEGVLVATIDLASGPPYVLEPVAAASLVHLAHPSTVAYAGWIEQWRKQDPRHNFGSSDALPRLRRIIAEHAAILDAVAALPEAPTRRLRLRHVVDRLADCTRVRSLFALTQEVVLPPDVLPFTQLRVALALAAERQLDAWVCTDGEAAWRSTRDHLRAALQAEDPLVQAGWSPRGQQALAELRRVVVASVDDADGPVAVLEGDERIFEERTRWVDLFSLESLPTPDPTVREASLWLAADGVADLRILVVGRRGSKRLQAALVGRERGFWCVWWIVDPHRDPDLAAAADALTRRLGSVASRDLELNVRRARLPELRERFTLSPRLADEQASRLIPFGGAFLPPSVSSGPLAAPAAPALVQLDEWAAGSDRIALIVGDLGAGKSTLLREWTLRRHASGQGPLPVRAVLPAADEIDSYALLLAAAGREPTPAERAALRLLLRYGHLVAVFDGLDEAIARRPDEARSLLHEALSVAADGKVLIASQSDLLGDLGDLAGHLEDVRLAPDTGVRKLRLAPLSAEQFVALVRRVRPDAEDVLTRIAATRDLDAFIRVPLLVGMLPQILDRIDPTVDVARADLFDRYAEGWLQAADTDAVAFVETLALALWTAGAEACALEQLRDAGPPPDPAPLFLAVEAGVARFSHAAFAQLFLARALLRRLPERTQALLAAAEPPPGLFERIADQLRREAADPQDSPWIRALRGWLLTSAEDPSLVRNEQRLCSSRAARYLHGVGSRIDSARQWIPRGTNLAHADLSKADLRGIRLAGVRLDAASLYQSDLGDAVLQDASMIGAHLNGVRLDHADLRGANLRMARLDGAEGDCCDLRGADLRGAFLNHSAWTECRWSDARIEPSDPAPWLNLRAAGTSLGHTLPAPWQLTSDTGMTRAHEHLEFSPDGRYLAATLGGRTHLVDLAEGTVRLLSIGSWRFCWAPHGLRFAFLDHEWRVHVGDLEAGLPSAGPLTFRPLERRAFALYWRPGDDHPLLLTRRGVEADHPDGWRVLFPQPPMTTSWQSYRPHLLASPRGVFVVGGFDGVLHLCREAGHPPRKLDDAGPFLDVRLAPSGDFLAYKGIQGLRVLDLRTPARPPYRVADEVEAIAWIPGGDSLAYARKGGFLTILDVERRRTVVERPLARRDPPRRADEIGTLAWRPDGARLAVSTGSVCVHVERRDGGAVCELFFTEEDHAVAVPNGCFALGDPDSRNYGVVTQLDEHVRSFPLAGLRRVLHRPDVVRAVLRDEDPPTTGPALLAGIGWDEPPGSLGDVSGAAPVGNPFLATRPLDGPELPGRAHVLRELEDLLVQRSPALVKGPRRAGKTSVLRALATRLQGRRVVHRLSLEARPPRNPDDLARLLDPSLADDPRAADTLRRRLVAGSADPPVILIDEIAWLEQADEQLFAWLRMLGQEGLAGLVLAGSHGDWVAVIKAANRVPGSSFGNDFAVVELAPLAEDDAVRFLVDTAPPDVPLAPSRVVAWILECCGTWPFYLQAMGYAVVEEVRAGHRRVLVDRRALVEVYERRLLRERLAVFRSRWSDLRRPAQELLLAELGRARAARRIELTPYRDLTRSARTILSDADLIDAGRGWNIDRPFRDWLHRNLDELELSDA